MKGSENRNKPPVSPENQEVSLDLATCEDREMKYCAFDHESKHYATKAELQELRTEIQKEGREVEKALRESEKRITSALTRILVAIVIAGIVFVFKDSLLNLFS